MACFSEASDVEATTSSSGKAKAAEDRIHQPVMVEEIVDFLAPQAGQWIIDGTLGFGGHSERFLAAGAHVFGIDQDPQAQVYARERLAGFGERLRMAHGNSAQLSALLAAEPDLPQTVDGVLFDLGVSSWQLDQAERGFSFQHDGPLDMRMNPTAERTAADLVNSLPEADLRQVLWDYGEERSARRIVEAIVQRRAERAFERTADLAAVIASQLRGRSRIHPATRTFQALRIAVNRELDVLPEMLSQSVAALKPGGKLAVISFHSLEDRIVKTFFRERSQAELDDPTWPEPRPNPNYQLDLPVKLVKPSAEESQRNPRARSARLRFAIKRA